MDEGATSSALVINELMAVNSTTILDDRNSFSDWIELMNRGTELMNLTGYSLADDNDGPIWKFPEGTSIEPGATLLVWADDGKTSAEALHASFKLSRGGETVVLFDPAGRVVDAVVFDELPSDVSFSRHSDGDVWLFSAEPTPGRPNGADGVRHARRAPLPVFSLPAGFYDERQALTLESILPNGEIRYTLDGSIPDRSAFLYSGSIDVESTTVVRARTYAGGMLPSQVVTTTLFIGEALQLPVISIATAPDYLWDDRVGIYTTGTNGATRYDVRGNYWRNWERPISLEFFEASPRGHTRVLQQDAGLRIAGARRNLAQKSLAVYARGTYGEESFAHPFFPDLDLGSFGSLLLRNGGYPEFRKTMLRDGIIQRMVSGRMNLDQQGFRPALLFLNGQFWGMQNIREKLNEEYLKGHKGLRKSEVDILENDQIVRAGDSIHYQALMDYLADADMTVSASYGHVAEQIDMDSYLDYLIAEIFFANADWPANNIKLWRPRAADGRWRWFFFDVEAGLGSWKPSPHNTLAYAAKRNSKRWSNLPWSTYLFRRLLENPTFRAEFVQRFAAHLNNTFRPERLHSVVDSTVAEVASSMPLHIKRWSGQCAEDGCGLESMEVWQENLLVIRNFIDTRPAHQRAHILDFFGLEGEAELSVDVTGEGEIRIASVLVEAGSVGSYFTGIPVRVHARPAPGYRFDHWGGDGIDASMSTLENIVIEVEEATNLRAIFARHDPTAKALDEIVEVLDDRGQAE